MFGCYVWLYMVCCVTLPVFGTVDGKQYGVELQKSISVFFAWCCEVSGGSLTACLGRACADLDATCGCIWCVVWPDLCSELLI